MEESELGKELAGYRIKHGLDQKDVAKRLGVTQQTVSNWELGKPIKPNRQAQVRRMIGGIKDDEFLEPEPINIRRPGLINSIAGSGMTYTDQMIEMEVDFEHALPEELRPNCNQTTRFGMVGWTVDYLSSKICAEMKYVASERFGHIGVERALLDMAVIRSIHQSRDAVVEHYALVLVGPGPQIQTGFKRIQTAATILGVTIYNCSDPEQAAALIADLEYGPLE